MTFTVGSLFAGIGGLELGLERAGMTVKWQVEIDEYCRQVLDKHWPDVPRWDDVCTFPPADWTAEQLEVDLICGGFPCQDISMAGKGAGLEGERSGLFYEIIRLAGIIRPKYLLLENVSALLARGLGTVLGELAQVGYDAQWHCIPAASVGARHRRDRVFILAYTERYGWDELDTNAGPRTLGTAAAEKGERGDSFTIQSQGSCKNVADTNGRENIFEELGWQQQSLSAWRETCWRNQWATESKVGRVADGIPRRVDRLRGLGNAVVPQVAEFIGRAIMEGVDHE